MKNAALLLLLFGALFYGMFTVGELAGGDVAGLQHLPPALILAALFWLAWRRPHAAGVLLLGISVPLGIAYIVILLTHSLPPPWALIVVLPPVLAGLLLLRADR